MFVQAPARQLWEVLIWMSDLMQEPEAVAAVSCKLHSVAHVGQWKDMSHLRA